MVNVEFGGKKENKANDRQLLVYIGLYYTGLLCIEVYTQVLHSIRGYTGGLHYLQYIDLVEL